MLLPMLLLLLAATKLLLLVGLRCEQSSLRSCRDACDRAKVYGQAPIFHLGGKLQDVGLAIAAVLHMCHLHQELQML